MLSRGLGGVKRTGIILPRSLCFFSSSLRRFFLCLYSTAREVIAQAYTPPSRQGTQVTQIFTNHELDQHNEPCRDWSQVDLGELQWVGSKEIR